MEKKSSFEAMGLSELAGLFSAARWLQLLCAVAGLLWACGVPHDDITAADVAASVGTFIMGATS